MGAETSVFGINVLLNLLFLGINVYLQFDICGINVNQRA